MVTPTFVTQSTTHVSNAGIDARESPKNARKRLVSPSGRTCNPRFMNPILTRLPAPIAKLTVGKTECPSCYTRNSRFQDDLCHHSY